VHPQDWDYAGLKKDVWEHFGVDYVACGIEARTLNRQELGDAIFARLVERYDAKERLIGPEAMRNHERIIMLSVLDQLWKDHLLGMDHLKEGIGLRGYGQHDPLVEYKRESFDMFEAMMERFEQDTVRYLFLMQILDQTGRNIFDGATVPLGRPDGEGGVVPARLSTSVDDMESQFHRRKKRELESARLASSASAEAEKPQQVVRGEKTGRNDPCPCGSGKKYKKCHGAGL
jgi:preprotein translocase subunit SecA